MQSRARSAFVLILAFSAVWGYPSLPPEAPGLPVPVVAELGSRLVAHTAHLQEQRLLPSPQDLEAIKKVAQILQMLGEQVIPAIIGELPGLPGLPQLPGLPDSPGYKPHAPTDIPNDPVNDN